MKRFVVAFMLFAIPAYADDTSPPPPAPLDMQEAMERSRKALDALKAMEVANNQLINIKTNQCMKAIGDSDFCGCLALNAPTKVSFTQYVEFFSFSPEDFDTTKLSPEAKTLYDGIRKARDKCVNWKKKGAN